VQPIALQIGPLPIYWYGILLAVAVGLGLWSAGRRGLRDNLKPELFHDLGLCLIIGVIVGARLLFVVSYWERDFAGLPFWNVFNIRSGGLVYYGGFIGGSLAVIIYAGWKKLQLWKIADAMAPSIALGYAVGRVGCLMTGCCYGRECQLPWAIRFPVGHETHLAGGDTVPVHPTQLYDTLLNLILYAGLAWLYRRKQFPGQVFAAYLVFYSVTRSIVEFFRGDYPAQNLHGRLTPAHLVSIGIFGTGIVLFLVLRRRAMARAAKTEL